MTHVRVLPDPEAVARFAADDLARRIDQARAAGAELHVALAGGGTPRRAYELLGQTDGSWKHVHLWLSDERCVPEDAADANARMIRESLLAADRAEPAQFHTLPSPEVPEDAAWLYSQQILAHVPGATFDVIHLGMGPDGHTASLFPGHPGLHVREAPCFAVRDSPKPPPERVSFSLPLLRAARYTLLLVTGSDKRDALTKVRFGDEPLPTALLGEGLDEIVCDVAAAGER